MELETDQSLLLSTLKSQWPTATELSYVVTQNVGKKRARAVGIVGKKIMSPKQGWGSQVYNVVTNTSEKDGRDTGILFISYTALIYICIFYVYSKTKTCHFSTVVCFNVSLINLSEQLST